MVLETNKRDGPREARHRNVKLSLMIVFLLFAACGNNKSFDSDVWLKADARTRGRMCEDLVKREILIGKTVEETQRVLGRADTVYATALSYKIDLGWPFKDPKHYALLVYLDENSSVREVKIVD